MKERWKKLPGIWGDRYDISSEGRVRSRHTGRLLKLYDKKRDRVIVTLNYGEVGERKTFAVARLVMETFSGQKLETTEVVKYRDGDPTNIAYSNLYVSSARERERVRYQSFITDAIDAALQGGRFEDVARQHNFGMPTAQRLLGIEYWNRLRKAAQKEGRNPS